MKSTPQTLAEWKRCASERPEQAAAVFLSRIRELSPELQRCVFAALPDERSLREAFLKSAAGNKSLPLSGAPYLLKDLFDFPGYPTNASSRFLGELRGVSQEEALISKAMRAQGAVFAGKTQLVEFAYGLTGENRTFGDCPHPIFPERLSGGSSSGSAWAVRRGIAPIAFGTDTGGSIRLPAAWCGIFGLRLSPNDWSTKGCFPLAPSFDTVGWFCSNAEDMATSIEVLVEPRRSESKPLRGLDLCPAIAGLPQAFCEEAARILDPLGAQADPAASEAYRAAAANAAQSYAVLQSCEALETHRPWIDSYRERYDPVVWQRIDRARHWSASEIDQAKQGESSVKAFLASCLRHYDFAVLPACQSPAISAAEHSASFRDALLALTAPGSLARCPILTVPVALPEGETMGLQFLYKEQTSDLPLRLLAALPQSDAAAYSL